MVGKSRRIVNTSLIAESAPCYLEEDLPGPRSTWELPSKGQHIFLGQGTWTVRTGLGSLKSFLNESDCWETFQPYFRPDFGALNRLYCLPLVSGGVLSCFPGFLSGLLYYHLWYLRGMTRDQGRGTINSIFAPTFMSRYKKRHWSISAHPQTII